jgi:hypothetical protein
MDRSARPLHDVGIWSQAENRYCCADRYTTSAEKIELDEGKRRPRRDVDGSGSRSYVVPTSEITADCAGGVAQGRHLKS